MSISNILSSALTATLLFLSGSVFAQKPLELKYNIYGFIPETYDLAAEFLLSPRWGLRGQLSYLKRKAYGPGVGEASVHLGGKYYPFGAKKYGAGVQLGLSAQFNRYVFLKEESRQPLPWGDTGWGLGLEAGYKWLIARRWVMEPSLRVAQLLYNRMPPVPNGVDSEVALYINVGYRFGKWE